MKQRSRIITYLFSIILLIILSVTFFSKNNNSNQLQEATSYEEIEAIRNRPFPLAGEEQFGHDAGMETGDEEQVELINREPVVVPEKSR